MRSTIAIVAVLVMPACQIDHARTCSTSSECLRAAGEPGTCVASPSSESSWCAYPDGSCADGLRFGALAGDGLAGECATGADLDGGTPDATPDADPGEELAVTLMGTGKGVVTSSPTGIDCGDVCSSLFPHAASVDLLAVPFTGSRFDGWGGDCSNAQTSCMVDMTQPHAVDATFSDVASWTKVGGAGGEDRVRAIAFRSGADIQIVGSFTGTITIGSETLSSDGPNEDIFLAQFTPSGMFRWAKRYGGSGNDVATAVAIDDANGGNVFVTGSFEETVNFGAGDVTAVGGKDVFVLYLLGDDGAYFDSTTFGGSGDDEGFGIAVDSIHNVVVTGTFRASADFGGGARTSFGDSDIFVAKLNDQLNWTWDHTYGAASTDEGHAVTIDGSDGILMTGFFTSSAEFGAPFTTLAAGASDIFVLRLEPDGSYSWVERYGGMTMEEGNDIKLDPSGAILVGGDFSSSSVSFGDGLPEPLMADGLSDGFILKLSSGGAPQWVAQVSGPGIDIVRGVAGSDDFVFAVGQFEQELDMGRGRHQAAGGTDGFMAKLDTATGEVLWTNAIGGSGDDAAMSADTNSVSQLIVGGSFSTTVDFGDGAQVSAGGTDFFAGRLLP